MLKSSPISQSFEVLSQDSATDELRARELYKYFRPPASDGEAPDPLLTAHAQLVAWRLNAERSMITLIDEEIQYFVAESTKTLGLDNPLEHEHPDDAIWAGCVRVSKAGRLCEHTIATSPPPGGGTACFEVLDLAEDSRFNTLEFVAGPPFFRNYAGVPLRTRNGINIGSLFVIGSKLRAPLTIGERHFLSVVADNIVKHLEMLKDKKDNERTVKMNACMSAYVDPFNRNIRRSSDPNIHHDPASPEHPPQKQDNHKQKVSETERYRVFTRAADYLQEAMDFDEHGGGVIFLDTLPTDSRSRHYQGVDGSGGTSSDQDSEGQEHNSHGIIRSEAHERTKVQESANDRKRPRIHVTDVLAHTYQPADGFRVTGLDKLQPTALSPKDLSKLIKRYPNGKLFTFDTQGDVVPGSSDEQPEFPSSSKGSESSTKMGVEREVEKLRSHFPVARQIIFMPLWDSTASRSSVCFIYHGSKYRNFTHKLEFIHCVTFSKCVAAEITRLASIQEDEQKSNFIASISHELRSPLHGILASCEFLEETDCTSFQRSLLNTADSCARTLLDTVNLVLDYSKINRLDRNRGKARRSKRTLSTKSHSQTLQSILSTYRSIDVAALVEEVVDGVAAGRIFEHHLDNIIAPAIKNINLQDMKPNFPAGTPTGTMSVKLVVDITQRDWTYWSEPGALRRIVMNLVDNALKYTEAGFVRVQLQAEEIQNDLDSSPRACVVLTVTDSGKGMSPAYMKDKLFSAFAQESSLTPGTGLGLSLVKSLVRTLGGQIDIESSVGIGTKVTVELPMVSMLQSKGERDSALGPGHHRSNIEEANEKKIDVVKVQAVDQKIAVHWHDPEGAASHQCKASQLMKQSLTAYLSGWLGHKVYQWHENSPFDLIISNEAGLCTLAQAAPQLFIAGCQDVILAVCTADSPPSFKLDLAKCGNIEKLRCPFGPRKLAMALESCFERLEHFHTRSLGTQPKLATEIPFQMPLEKVEADTPRITSLYHDPKVKEDSRHEAVRPNLGEEYVNTAAALICDGFVPVIGIDKFEETNAKIAASAELDKHIKKDATLEHITTDITANPPVPLSNGPPNLAAYDVSDKSAPTKKSSCPTHRILLVDDNVINLRLLQVYAKKLGYTVVGKAENGLDAVNAYQSLLYESPPRHPEIILMDISMPIMNGFEATRQIREIEEEHNRIATRHSRNCLIIALTGLTSIRDQKEAFASGVDMYIMKPVNFAKLSVLLETWEASDGTEAPESSLQDLGTSAPL